MSQLFESGGQRIGASTSASVLPMNIKDWFPLGWIGVISLLSRRFSAVFSSTTVQKYQFIWCSAFFIFQVSYLYMTTGKIIVFIIWISVSKVMSFLFNKLSQFVKTFLLRSRLLIMAAVTICSEFRAQEEVTCHCFHLSPFYLPWSDGTGCHDLSLSLFFLILHFKKAFSLSSFTLNKRLCSSSSLSAIRVVSSLYLRLLLFLLAVLSPACNSFSMALHMMCSAYKLNKQGDNYSHVVRLSQSWNNLLFHVQFCFFLTGIQVSQKTGKVVWSSHLFKNFEELLKCLPQWMPYLIFYQIVPGFQFL